MENFQVTKGVYIFCFSIYGDSEDGKDANESRALPNAGFEITLLKIQNTCGMFSRSP
jgi:hypothetical protein